MTDPNARQAEAMAAANEDTAGELADPIAEACSHVIANLTPAEWAQYFPGEEYHVTCRGLP